MTQVYRQIGILIKYYVLHIDDFIFEYDISLFGTDISRLITWLISVY